MKRKITISLDGSQERELELLMRQDGQSNFTYYFVYLIMQEKKRRMEDSIPSSKRPVGRPKKEEVIEDNNKYPAPYAGGAPYTRSELEMYYEFRKEEMPTLPDPLTDEEIKKYE